MKLSKMAKITKGGAIDIFKNNILHNQFVLYFVFIISLFYLFYFSVVNDYTLVAIFILTGWITSFFSKNMVVILCISLVVSFLLRQGTTGLEGFEDSADSSSSSKSSSPSSSSGSNSLKTMPTPTDIQKTLENSKADISPEKLDKLKDSYKELYDVGTKLLGTQEQIIEKFGTIEPHIKQAEDLVEQMNKAVDSMKTITTNPS